MRSRCGTKNQKGEQFRNNVTLQLQPTKKSSPLKLETDNRDDGQKPCPSMIDSATLVGQMKETHSHGTRHAPHQKQVPAK